MQSGSKTMKNKFKNKINGIKVKYAKRNHWDKL